MSKETGNNDICTKRILVVEDERSISNVCQRVLAREGFDVDIAGDGKVATAMIREKQYDYMLIDIRTPQMDGKGLYNWLKEEYPQLASKAVFMTGDAMGGDTQSFLKAIGQPFLLKPFNPSELTSFAREVFRD